MKNETKTVKAKILAQKAKELPFFKGLSIQNILERKSNCSKILRITSYFLKFLFKAINGIKDGNKRKHLEHKYFSKHFLTKPDGQFPRSINPNYLRCATNFHIREEQAKIFHEELNSLKFKENIKSLSKLDKLDSYLDRS